MMRLVPFAAALMSGLVPLAVCGQAGSGVSKRFKALKYTPAATEAGTWRILKRDGANRRVEPYLSSLGLGESGTGSVVSPVFTIATGKITMTLCGHDGPQGTRKKNFVALVDAATGKFLRQTFAPLSDPMRPGSWDVGELRGRSVRFEAHDGDTEGAFAWLGVGMIDAGSALKVDFRQGLPKSWKATAPKRAVRTEEVKGGIPFLSLVSSYSMIPESGAAEIPCGFEADRLFLLGGTVFRFRPLEICGYVEIEYREGPSERHPLMSGYTLDGEHKLPSKSAASYLHPSGDLFQYYVVLKPRDQVIEKIRLERNSREQDIPRITAITCETAATSKNLLPLPDCEPGAEEAAWIESHSISPASPGLDAVMEEIRRAHKLVPRGKR